MFCRVNSIGISGMEGYQVRVEVDVSNGLPGFSMVGYLGSEVREARDRVLTAIKNSGFQCPPRKITVNLSPANIKKEGTAFDLPIAVGVLGAYGWISTDELRQVVIAGELGLNGEVKGIRGALTMAGSAGEMGMTHFFLPEINRREGQAAGGIPVTGVSCLRELTDLLNRGEKDWNRLKQEEEEKNQKPATTDDEKIVILQTRKERL